MISDLYLGASRRTRPLPRGYRWTRNFLPRLPIADFRLQIAPVVEASAALGSASELVVLVFEQDVERRERSVTAGNILLQFERVRIAQFAWHAVASAKEGRSRSPSAREVADYSES